MDDSSYWFSQVLIVIHVSVHSAVHDAQEFDFVQYFELKPQEDKIDRILNCIFPRLAADDYVDQSINFNFSPSDTIEAGEWYGQVPVSSVRSVHHIVRSNYYVSQFLLQHSQTAY